MILDWFRKVLWPAPEAPSGDRLDSWKEIAAYLRRDGRTVQRWEAQEGLPVSRRAGKQRAAVFAHKNELDAWWEQHKNRVGSGGLKNGLRGWRRLPPMGLAVALGAVIAAGVAAYRLVEDQPEGQEGWSSDVGIAALRFGWAAVSPDGRWLAYTDERQAHLWLRDLHSGQDRLLVSEWTELFAWSRDGRHIAYAGRLDPPHRMEIIAVVSGETALIAEAGSLQALPKPYDWSLDGERLLCTRVSTNNPRSLQMGFVSAADGAFVPFITVPRGNDPIRSLRLSPDDSLVAYSSRRDGNYNIFVTPTDGSGQQIPLTWHPGWDREPVWTPDGRLRAFRPAARHRSGQQLVGGGGGPVARGCQPAAPAACGTWL